MYHIYIFLTVILVVYSQLIMKWQVGMAGELPIGIVEKITFLIQILFRPWVISGLTATFLSGLTWMAAMTRFPINYAYPFTSLSFILILIGSSVFFHEAITIPKAIGTGFIVTGVIIASQG